MIKNCIMCKKEFNPINPYQTCCSNICVYRKFNSNIKDTRRSCIKCNSLFNPKYKNHYCCKKCRPNDNPVIIIICKNCNVDYETRSHKRVYCDKCSQYTKNKSKLKEIRESSQSLYKTELN